MPTKKELEFLQSLPLEVKIEKTKIRIKEFVDYFGKDGVYISFSGGKDSTVLIDICRDVYPDMKAVFFDTGLEFPEIRNFVDRFENVDVVKPSKNFKEIISEYGYPVIGKDVANVVYFSRKKLEKKKDENTISNWDDVEELVQKMYENNEKGWQRISILLGVFSKDKRVIKNIEAKDRSKFSKKKHRYLLEAPFYISDRCCNEMKKKLSKEYKEKTGRVPITAQTADESMSRTMTWMKNGCNSFCEAHQISNPMSFWNEQDILKYIKQKQLSIASVYGNICYSDKDGMFYENDVFDMGMILKTTGCNRTGCAFCGFGCQFDERPNRYELIDLYSNKNIRDYCLRGGCFDGDIWKPSKDGLGFWFVIKWLNIHGKTNIYIPDEKLYEEKYGNEKTRMYLYGGVESWIFKKHIK